MPQDAKPALDVLRGLGGDEMVAMMMRTFLQFAEERLAALAEVHRSGRLGEVAGIAHSLKSSARQLGALALGEACAVTEKAGRAGDTDGARTGVAAIEQEFATAAPWMRALAAMGSSGPPAP